MKSSVAVAAICLLMVTLWPHRLAAMTIEQFEGMVGEDQRHYVAFLVAEAQKLLIVQGEPELAKQIERVFRAIRVGPSDSLGDVQFEMSLRAARSSHVRMSLWHAPSSEVEFAFCDALFKLGIKATPAFFTAFGEVTRNRMFFRRPSQRGNSARCPELLALSLDRVHWDVPLRSVRERVKRPLSHCLKSLAEADGRARTD
jgi:hypothetical protein